MPLLECVGLVKDYPGMRAVDGINFSVERGEIVGLLGPNGAGKTTVFRMACGMIAPTEGRVLLKGIDVTDWPMYKRAQQGMGYLPQEDSIFAKLTVEQNILAILEYGTLQRQQREQSVQRLLAQFGLEDKRKQIASTLSGGERRRLEIARCLATEPSLILLDEPFAGIDPKTIYDIQDIIAVLRNSGIAILLTDHRERETLAITDRSYVICAGKVVVSGDAGTVLNSSDAQDRYFGTRFDAASIIEGKEAFASVHKELSIAVPNSDLPQISTDQTQLLKLPMDGDDQAFTDRNTMKRLTLIVILFLLAFLCIWGLHHLGLVQSFKGTVQSQPAPVADVLYFILFDSALVLGVLAIIVGLFVTISRTLFMRGRIHAGSGDIPKS